MSKKLTGEEKEQLLELVQQDGMGPLLNELERLVEATESALIQCNSEDEKALLRSKCKAEGARMLWFNFSNLVKNLKSKSI